MSKNHTFRKIVVATALIGTAMYIANEYIMKIATSKDLLKKYGLEEFIYQYPNSLSGGMRQRVALIRAIVTKPKLLLLDEHTAALDPATAEKVLKITKEIIAEKNITTMMITHNMQSSLDLGNRTIMMDSGRVILDIKGKERSQMTVPDLLELFKKESNKELDNDRMLLAK